MQDDVGLVLSDWGEGYSCFDCQDVAGDFALVDENGGY